MLGPLPRRSHGVHIPVSPSVSSASPQRGLGRLPASFREYDFSRGGVFEAADISLCSGLRVCSSPRSFLPLHNVPQGSRDFYIRAERASLPLHAPDMLAVRIQALDGTRTSTLLDSQACWPLPSPPPHTARCQGRSKSRPQKRSKGRPEEQIGDRDCRGGGRLERRPAPPERRRV